MGIFILVGLIIIALAIGLIFLSYWLPKKLGYPKLGKALAKLLGLSFIILTVYIVFEDQLFSKKDAIKLLTEQDIHLLDKFEIIDNKSMSAPGDYYHSFNLKITDKDKQLIISQIKNSPNFKGLKDQKEDLLLLNEDRYLGKKLKQNYEDEFQFVREYYEPNGKGIAPTYRKIEIDKKESKLTFEDIDE